MTHAPPTVEVLRTAALPEPPAGSDGDRFARAMRAIDAVNADDPNELEIDGERFPKELAHARLATAWVLHFDPHATEAQLFAARAHHLRRWSSPRDDYPRDRAGYLRWRAALKKRHAEEVGQLLVTAGYDESLVTRVGQIVRKEGLGRDPQVQVHEDALCLVFVQTQLQWLTDQLGDDRIVPVVQKTMKKMSPQAIAAVGRLDLGAVAQRVLAQATA